MLNGLVLTSLTMAVGGAQPSLNLATAGNAAALGLGALAPDLDSPASAISRAFPPARLIHRRWRHRTLLHSLVGLLVAVGLFYLVAAGVRLLAPSFPGGQGTLYFAASYISHLMADCLTVRGVPFLYPYPISFAFPSPEHLRLRTGRRKHELGFAGLSLVASFVYLPVVWNGGAEASLHRALGTLPAAFEDYRKLVGQETQLVFAGFDAVSKDPVEGQGLVIEASPTHFLVVFRGAVVPVGQANTPIVATTARCLPTGRPIKLSTVTVNHETWPAVLARLPASALVSGELVASHPFDLGTPVLLPASITATASGLKLVYAQPPELAALDIRPRTDSAQLTAKLAALEADQQAVARSMAGATAARGRSRSAYERDRLFNEIVDLRRQESTLKGQVEQLRRDLAAVQAIRVTLSGQLNVRSLIVDKPGSGLVNNRPLLLTPAVSGGSCPVAPRPPLGAVARPDNTPTASAVLQSPHEGGAL